MLFLKIKRISSPNAGMKKIMAKRFEVYLIDEYNTSRLHHKTSKEGKNMKKTTKYEENGKIYEHVKSIHSIFTFKTSKEYKVCINRDYNACLNMEKITRSVLLTTKRPKEYERKPIRSPAREFD